MLLKRNAQHPVVSQEGHGVVKLASGDQKRKTHRQIGVRLHLPGQLLNLRGDLFHQGGHIKHILQPVAGNAQLGSNHKIGSLADRLSVGLQNKPRVF